MEHEESKGDERDLHFAMFVTIAIMIIQILGFYLSNSLALLSDTVHVLSDLVAMAIGFIALKMALKKPTENRTFGFHRAEVFSAAFNGTMLIVLTIFITIQAVNRLFYPSDVTPLPLLFTAFIGLVGNVFVAVRLQKNENMNMHGIFLHVAGDALSSIGVLVGAIIIYITGLSIVDSIISLVIAVILSISAYHLIRNALSILLESAPKNATTENIIKILLSVNGVKDIHDVHIWSICSDIHYATAHVVVEDKKISTTKEIIDRLNEKIKKIGISHSTFQIESMICKNNVCYTWHENNHTH